MQVRNITIGRKVAQGIEIPLKNAVLVIVVAKKGYLMCGYLNKDTAEKLGDCAAIIRGVRTIDELLAGKVAELTSAAKKAGVREDMPGIRALGKMM